MEENGEINEEKQSTKGNSEIEGKGKFAREVKEAKDTAEAAVKLVANIESGNVVEAVKNAAKLAKSKAVKKKIKKGLMNILVGLLIVVMIVTAIYSIFKAVYEKVVVLLSSIGRELRSFWKWIIDDYWIRLDDDIEYTIIDDTRSGSNKKRQIGRRIYKTIIRPRYFTTFTKIIRRF